MLLTPLSKKTAYSTITCMAQGGVRWGSSLWLAEVSGTKPGTSGLLDEEEGEGREESLPTTNQTGRIFRTSGHSSDSSRRKNVCVCVCERKEGIEEKRAPNSEEKRM